MTALKRGVPVEMYLRGDDGMKRWVGLGVIADNLINIGRFVATT